MGLFVCDNCDCIENTALGLYWSRNNKNLWPPEILGKALCSECAPLHFKGGERFERFTGKWHGKFPKRKYDPNDGRKYQNR